MSPEQCYLKPSSFSAHLLPWLVTFVSFVPGLLSGPACPADLGCVTRCLLPVLSQETQRTTGSGTLGTGKGFLMTRGQSKSCPCPANLWPWSHPDGRQCLCQVTARTPQGAQRSCSPDLSCLCQGHQEQRHSPASMHPNKKNTMNGQGQG